jgi:hypothetical protein
MNMDTYSVKEKGKRYTHLLEVATAYLGRKPIEHEIIVLWVHCDIMDKRFLKSFEVKYGE